MQKSLTKIGGVAQMFNRIDPSKLSFEELKKRIEKNPFEAKSQRVDHLALFKSEKDSDNHKYHVLERN